MDAERPAPPEPDLGSVAAPVLVVLAWLLFLPLGLMASVVWLARRPRRYKLAVSCAGLWIGVLASGGLVLQAWMHHHFTTRCHEDPAWVLHANADAIAAAAEEWAIDHDFVYPPDLQTLFEPDADGVAYLKGSYPLDPWGRPYNYRPPSPAGDLRVWSWGADGLPGGEGPDSDVDQTWPD